MKIIIFGVLCLWKATEGSVSAQIKDVLQVLDAPRASDEFVTKSLNGGAGASLPEYLGLLVDTKSIREQAQNPTNRPRPAASTPPHSFDPRQSPGPFQGRPPAGPVRRQIPVETPQSRNHFDPYTPAPRRQPQVQGPHRPSQQPTPGNSPSPTTGEMFKLEAYITKDGRIVSGGLTSLEDTARNMPRVEEHQYITSRVNEVGLNRPSRSPASAAFYNTNPFSQYAPSSRPAYNANPFSQYASSSRPPGSNVHNLINQLASPSQRSQLGSAPRAQPRPASARRPQRAFVPQSPNDRRSQEDVDAVVNDLVQSSTTPTGKQVNPQLAQNIVEFLDGETLTNLATSMINDNQRHAIVPQENPSDPNGQAFNRLGNLINQQLQEKMHPILKMANLSK